MRSTLLITCKGDDRIRYQIRLHTCTRYLCNAAQKELNETKRKHKKKQKQQQEKNNKSYCFVYIFFTNSRSSISISRPLARTLKDMQQVHTLVVGLSPLLLLLLFFVLLFSCFFCLTLCIPFGSHNTIVSLAMPSDRQTPSERKREGDWSTESKEMNMM